MNIILSTNRIHRLIKSRYSPVRPLVILTFFGFLSVMDAPALSTGVPIQFTIDPATVRKREKDETPLVATVVLKVPSPSFFVCQIRSSDKDEITFTDIVFKKGQIIAATTTTLGLIVNSAIKARPALRPQLIHRRLRSGFALPTPAMDKTTTTTPT
jgi:hypothetical protein